MKAKKGVILCLIIALCSGIFCACGSGEKGSGKSSGKGGVSSDTDTKKEDGFFEDVGNDPNNLLQDRGLMAFDDDYIYYVKDERTLVKVSYDESKQEEIACSEEPRFLNVYEGNLYYFSSEERYARLYKIDLKTGEENMLYQRPFDKEWWAGNISSMLVTEGYAFCAFNYEYTTGMSTSHDLIISAVDLKSGTENIVFSPPRESDSEIMLTVSSDHKLYAIVGDADGFDSYSMYAIDINEFKSNKGSTMTQVTGSMNIDSLNGILFYPEGIYYPGEDSEHAESIYYYRKPYENIDADSMNWPESKEKISTDIMRKDSSPDMDEDERFDWEIRARGCIRFKVGSSIVLYGLRRQDDQVYVDYIGYPDMDFEKGKVVLTINTGSMDDMSYYDNMGVYKGKLYVLDPESGHIVAITEDDIK